MTRGWLDKAGRGGGGEAIQGEGTRPKALGSESVRPIERMGERQWGFVERQGQPTEGFAGPGNEFGFYAKCHDCRVLCKRGGFGPICFSGSLFQRMDCGRTRVVAGVGRRGGLHSVVAVEMAEVIPMGDLCWRQD